MVEAAYHLLMPIIPGELQLAALAVVRPSYPLTLIGRIRWGHCPSVGRGAGYAYANRALGSGVGGDCSAGRLRVKASTIRTVRRQGLRGRVQSLRAKRDGLWRDGESEGVHRGGGVRICRPLVHQRPDQVCPGPGLRREPPLLWQTVWRHLPPMRIQRSNVRRG